MYSISVILSQRTLCFHVLMSLLLPVDMSYDELVEIFLEEQYSRLPVYEESKDNVIGILNLKDLILLPGDTPQ